MQKGYYRKSLKNRKASLRKIFYVIRIKISILGNH